MSEQFTQYLPIIIYALPVLLFIIWRRKRRKKRHSHHADQIAENKQAGLTEPASLHPKIDRHQCIGCNTCAAACPEGNVLGLVGNRVELIHPTHCIGHGACAAACPVGAISLVFGTEKRGIDIPYVNPEFETNIPGIFIAGELGGMGLIRNAVTQGRQAMDTIAKKTKGGKDPSIVDVVIVGAGPAGFSATLGAIQHKLKYVTIEQESFGGTVSHYPRGKIVMTQPAELPIIGKVNFRETTKEALMEFWEKTAKQANVKVSYLEAMKSITVAGDHLVVGTSKNEYKTRNVLLAIGRRGSPRKLGVPGEDVPKVVYRLIDAEQYRDMHVLVVGGGDSALEAATTIADQPGTTVTLSYRSESFSRAKPKNRQRVDDMSASGELTVMYSSNVKQIEEKTVTIEHDGKMVEIPNEAIIVSAGGILPTPLLKEIGITVETKFGTK